MGNPESTADAAIQTPATGCPLTAALRAIGGKWNLICLYWLELEPRRFNELQRLMPDICDPLSLLSLGVRVPGQPVRDTSGGCSAIMNPLHLEIVKACMGADVMMGHDPDCARWIRKFREAPAMQASGGAAPPTEGAARGRREGGHRRRVT